MAIAHVASATAGGTTAGTSQTSITCNKPTGTLTGHVLVAAFVFNDPRQITPTISGWFSPHTDYIIGQSGSSNIKILIRVVTASDPASYTFNFDGSTFVGVGIAAWSGVDTVNPVPNYPNWQWSTVTSTSVPTPAFTTFSAAGVGSMMIKVVGCKSGTNASFTITQPSTWNESFEVGHAETGNYNRVELAYLAQATDGAVAATNHTSSITAVSAGVTFCLQQAIANMTCASSKISLSANDNQANGAGTTYAGVTYANHQATTTVVETARNQDSATAWPIRIGLYDWTASQFARGKMSAGVVRGYINTLVNGDSRSLVGEWKTWNATSADWQHDAPTTNLAINKTLSTVTTGAFNDFPITSFVGMPIDGTDIELKTHISGGQPVGQNIFQMRAYDFDTVTAPLRYSPELIIRFQPTQDVSLTGFADTEAFGVESITSGPLTVSPTGFSDTEAFGAATSAQVQLAPTGFSDAEAYGTATSYRLSTAPTGFVDTESYGTLFLSTILTVFPTGFSETELFGSSAVQIRGSPTGFSDVEDFGVIFIDAIGNAMFVDVDGFSDVEGFGNSFILSTSGILFPSAIISGSTQPVSTIRDDPNNSADTTWLTVEG